jgi:hypothetical protein
MPFSSHTWIVIFQALVDHGITTWGAHELRSKILEKYGVKLPENSLFQFPSVQAMADFIVVQLNSRAPVRLMASKLGKNVHRMIRLS